MNGNDVGRPAHDERTADGRQRCFVLDLDGTVRVWNRPICGSNGRVSTSTS